jgi:transposase
MLSASCATRVWLACGATDMRKSFNSLYALVNDKLGEDPSSGHLFVFCNRRRDRIKTLHWDGSGLWICAKRLEGGTFRWPAADAQLDRVELDWTQLQALLGGLDTSVLKSRNWIRKKK